MKPAVAGLSHWAIGGNMAHPGRFELPTSGLGNRCSRSNLAQSGAFSPGAVPVWHNDAQGREPLSVQTGRRGNGMTLAARARLTKGAA